jgi:hypothetical protein
MFHVRCIPNICKTDSTHINRTNDWYCVHCISKELPFNHYLLDDDYIESLALFYETKTCTSMNELNNMVFNPFDLNENEKYVLYDINSDQHYFSQDNMNIPTCEYM